MFQKQVETYMGDYWFVKEEIRKRIQKENATNARLKKAAQKKKDQANKFAGKGGGLRKVAKTMRGVAAEMEDQLQDVRREDFALRDFEVPFYASSPSGAMVRIENVSAYQRSVKMSEPLELRRGSKVQVIGPNGIGKIHIRFNMFQHVERNSQLTCPLCFWCKLGKTTFLEMIVNGTAPGVKIDKGADIGYYRQDFHNFDFDSTVISCLEKASDDNHTMEEIRQTAGGFFIGNRLVKQRVATLSEGQKGLLSLACLCLQRPTVLVLDEPTNHINFRHLPALAKAVDNFKGAVLLVSHDDHFVNQVGVSATIDMGKVLNA